MKSARWRVLGGAVGVFCIAVASAHGHAVHHRVSMGESVVVTLSHDDGTPFAFQRYEVYGEGESEPFQVGRTDRYGRVTFIRGAHGQWRLHAFSADGHGVTVTGEAAVEDEMGAAPSRGTRAAGILAGVGILMGVFGIVSLLVARRDARDAHTPSS